MIGWTYESDQNAIIEANENLVEAEKERDQTNIQYHIDLLNKMNDIINGVQKNEEWAALREEFWSAFPDNMFSGVASFLNKWDEEWSSEKLSEKLKLTLADVFDHRIVKIQMMKDKDTIIELANAYKEFKKVKDDFSENYIDAYNINTQNKAEKYNVALGNLQKAISNASSEGINDDNIRAMADIMGMDLNSIGLDENFSMSDMQATPQLKTSNFWVLHSRAYGTGEGMDAAHEFILTKDSEVTSDSDFTQDNWETIMAVDPTTGETYSLTNYLKKLGISDGRIKYLKDKGDILNALRTEFGDSDLPVRGLVLYDTQGRHRRILWYDEGKFFRAYVSRLNGKFEDDFGDIYAALFKETEDNEYYYSGYVWDTETGEIVKSSGQIEQDYNTLSRAHGTLLYQGMSTPDEAFEYFKRGESLGLPIPYGNDDDLKEWLKRVYETPPTIPEDLITLRDIVAKNFNGEIDYSGGNTFINERGSEGIITPNGEFGSMDSYYGANSEDITRKMYDLASSYDKIISFSENSLTSNCYGMIKECITGVDNVYANIHVKHKNTALNFVNTIPTNK